jgi:hypothetical protein
MGKRWLVKLYFAERGRFRHVELRGTEWTIGRAPTSSIELAYKTVSKNHARLVVRDGKLLIVDVKSANGTYVNGQRVSLPRVVDPSAKLYISEVVFGLLAGPTPIDDDKPAVTWVDAAPAVHTEAPKPRAPTVDPLPELEFGELDVDEMPPPTVPFAPFEHRFDYALLAPIAPGQPSAHAEHERAFVAACDPPVFPGGDLGTVAVIGAIDELAALERVRAKTLDLHITVEAGASLQLVRRALRSAVTTARAAGTQIVAARGVVAPRGAVDGIALAVTARGDSPNPRVPLRDGMPLVVSKPVGAFGAALLNVDDAGVTIAAELAVDTIAASTRAAAAATMHRDGGLRAACLRLATDEYTIELDDWLVPVRDDVRRFARARGVDPLALRSSGIVMIVQQQDVHEPLTVIGRVHER